MRWYSASETGSKIIKKNLCPKIRIEVLLSETILYFPVFMIKVSSLYLSFNSTKGPCFMARTVEERPNRLINPSASL